MISLDFLQFDQANLWFFLVSALGLFRERRALPFVMVAVANLVHGAMAATLVAGLIFWHQVDVAPKWVQLKAALGFLLIFMAAVSPEPFQAFAICSGVLTLSISFGRGGSGVIPAVLLLRQFDPHPPDLEILLGVAAFYWIAAEGLALLKLSQEKLIRAILETLCGLGVMFGFRDLFLKLIDEPVLLGLGAGLLVVILFLTLIVQLKAEAFWSFYRKMKPRIARALTIGNRVIKTEVFWVRDSKLEESVDVERGFNRLFVLAILTMALLASFCMMSRGGFG